MDIIYYGSYTTTKEIEEDINTIEEIFIENKEAMEELSKK